MKRLAILFAMGWMLVCVGNLFAKTWTSPDTTFSMELPDEFDLQPVPSPMPGAKTWQGGAGDRLVSVTIAKTPVPMQSFELKGLEEGVVQGLPGGELIRSGTRKIKGYLVCEVEARSIYLGVYAKQSAFMVNGRSYTVAVGGPVEVSNDPKTSGILTSIAINAMEVPDAVKQRPGRRLNMILSGAILLGGVGAICLWGKRKAMRSGKTPPPMPPSMPPPLP